MCFVIFLNIGLVTKSFNFLWKFKLTSNFGNTNFINNCTGIKSMLGKFVFLLFLVFLSLSFPLPLCFSFSLSFPFMFCYSYRIFHTFISSVRSCHFPRRLGIRKCQACYVFKSFSATNFTNKSLPLVLMRMSWHMQIFSQFTALAALRNILLLKKQHRDR